MAATNSDPKAAYSGQMPDNKQARPDMRTGPDYDPKGQRRQEAETTPISAGPRGDTILPLRGQKGQPHWAFGKISPCSPR
jgi:hypothetical protein